MSNLTAYNKSTRTALYADVIRLQMVEHMTQAKACEEVGVTEASFRNFRDSDPEAVALFQGLMGTSTRESLSLVLVTRTKVLSQLVEDAMNPGVSPGVRLAIFKELDNQLSKLANDARLGAADAGAANDVLSGPKLEPGISRFAIEQTAKTTTVTIERAEAPFDVSFVDVLSTIDPTHQD